MTEEHRTQQEVRALSDLPPSDEFRARLREQFIAGEIPELVSAEEPGKVVPLIRVLGGLLIAAAFAGLFFVMNRGPEWEFVGAAGEGQIVVGDVAFPIERAAELFPDLPPGTEIRFEGDGMLDLVSPGVLALQMAPGSSVLVPSRPGRWVGRAMSGEVTDGEVRFVTGPDFAGRGLGINAPGAHIEVTGTTFAVICAPESTCVCVLEGEVRMDDDSGGSELVPAGTRRSIFLGDGTARAEEIFQMERMKLEMLREQAVGRFGVAGP